MDWLPKLRDDLTDSESESQHRRVHQRFNNAMESARPARILPFPTGISIPQVVFGLAADEMLRLLTEDEEEDRAIFDQMFEASFLRRTPDASEDD